MAHFHERGIAHRDLKPDNILVKLELEKDDILPLKIIDFGVSKRFKGFYAANIT